MIKHQHFLFRYLSISSAKIALLTGRSIILIASYQWLSKLEFSLLTATISAIEILRIVSDFGTENIIYSRLSDVNQPIKNIVRHLIKFRLVLAVITSLLLSLINLLYFKENIWLLFSLIILNVTHATNISFMQKNREYKKVFILVFTVFIFATLSVLACIQFQLRGNDLYLSIILPELTFALLGLAFTRTQWHTVIQHNNFKKVSRLIKFVIPSALLSFFTILYSRLDVALVLPLLKEAAQAEFSVAMRLIDPIFALVAMGAISLLAELGAKNSKHANQITFNIFNKLNTKFIVSIICLGLFASATLSYIAMHLLKFSSLATYVLFIMALTIPIKMLNTVYTTILIRNGNFYAVLKASIITLLITFSLGTLLAIYFGIIGVSISTLLAESINSIYQRYIVSKQLQR